MLFRVRLSPNYENKGRGEGCGSVVEFYWLKKQLPISIDKHHQEPVRISDLATHLHLSPSRAAHVIRESCNETWSALLCRARLRTACELLQHSDHDMIQIALISGFGDQSLFHKMFKRHFKISPGQYRRDPEASYG